MATLASTFKRHAATAVPMRPAVWDSGREIGHTVRLRPLPNEDIYFFCKRIDNSRLLREADPKSGRRCWGFIGKVSALGVLVLLMLLPKLGWLLAGYRIEALKQEHQHLMEVQNSLELEEARMLSPERLQELARMQELVDPAPVQVVFLNPKGDGSLALNVTNH